MISDGMIASSSDEAHTRSHMCTHVKTFFYPHPLPVQETAPKTVSRGVTERVSAGILLYSLDCTMTRLVAAARRNLLVCHSPPAKLHTGFQYNSLGHMHINCDQHHALHDTSSSCNTQHTAQPVCIPDGGVREKRDRPIAPQRARSHATTCETLDGWHNAKEE